jgi:hypothetical protein
VLVGPGVWSAWLIIIVVSFAVLETWAIVHKGKTLSRVVADAANGWPLLPFIYGSLFSGLAVHFFWHFC